MSIQSPLTMPAIALRTLGFVLTVPDQSTLRRVKALISSQLKAPRRHVASKSRPTGATNPSHQFFDEPFADPTNSDHVTVVFADNFATADAGPAGCTDEGPEPPDYNPCGIETNTNVIGSTPSTAAPPGGLGR